MKGNYEGQRGALLPGINGRLYEGSCEMKEILMLFYLKLQFLVAMSSRTAHLSNTHFPSWFTFFFDFQSLLLTLPLLGPFTVGLPKESGLSQGKILRY